MISLPDVLAHCEPLNLTLARVGDRHDFHANAGDSRGRSAPMPLTTNSDYELVEMNVLPLDDVLAMVQAQAAAITSAGQQVPAEVQPRSNQVHSSARQPRSQVHTGGLN
jgi:hypothetical protein